MSSVLYLQDCLAEFNQEKCPERFTQSTSNGYKKVLIVDLGSWQCRAGWAGDSSPSRKKCRLNYFKIFTFPL